LKREKGGQTVGKGIYLKRQKGGRTIGKEIYLKRQKGGRTFGKGIYWKRENGSRTIGKGIYPKRQKGGRVFDKGWLLEPSSRTFSEGVCFKTKYPAGVLSMSGCILKMSAAGPLSMPIFLKPAGFGFISCRVGLARQF
jgi:hypothetical protein